jgi:hypothetical protein
MTTKFESVESAKNYAAYLAGVDPKTTEFVEDSKLKVEDMSCMLLNDPKTSEEIKKEIRDRIAAQKGFRFKNRDGKEVSIVIGPFRDGFDLWLIAPNGWAQRA